MLGRCCWAALLGVLRSARGVALIFENEVRKMPGTRQSTDVIKANGRKHLSRAEEAERRAGEVQAAKPKQVRAPKWLPDSLRGDFKALGRKLLDAGLYTELDGDNLGRYLLAHRQYLLAAQEAQAALDAGDLECVQDWSAVQDRYFKQARACANDLGLTVTSRCRLVVPKPQEPEETNPFMTLIQGGQARRA